MLLPQSTPYVSGEVSLFDMAVRSGEEKSHIVLSAPLHAFLVRCLLEHLRDPGIVHNVLAIGLLSVSEKSGEQIKNVLKQTGDEALILAGLFPDRAARLGVSLGYFRHMGRAAYVHLAAQFFATGRKESGKLYNTVAAHFPRLEHVLFATRDEPASTWDSFLKTQKYDFG